MANSKRANEQGLLDWVRKGLHFAGRHHICQAKLASALEACDLFHSLIIIYLLCIPIASPARAPLS